MQLERLSAALAEDGLRAVVEASKGLPTRKVQLEQPSPPLPRIDRKSLLYRSGIGFFCVNHVQGCSHGCRYPCHAFAIFQRHGRVRDYAEWCQPRLVGNALELLERELRSKRRLPERVHLCLSTDPFMLGQPEVSATSLGLIERLNAKGIACSVLTKGILPLELTERPRFRSDNVLGISLISLDERFRRQWEPGAAEYGRRIAALRALHDAGCATYAHLEPYPTPNLVTQDMRMILDAVSFVDRIFFGRWNYNPRVQRFVEVERFYCEQRDRVARFCAAHGIAFEGE